MGYAYITPFMLAAATDSAVLAALTSSWFGIADRTPAAAIADS